MSARVLFFASLLAACGGSAVSSSSASPEAGLAGAPALDERTIHRVIDDVAAARQLVVTRPIDVTRLDLATFRREVAIGIAPSGRSSAADDAFLVGFDFVPPAPARAGASSTSDVLAEQIAGFYDIDADRIVIPVAPFRGEDDALEQRAVLAHEVHHALQARHFPEAKNEPPAGDDARLARLALIEGDAQVSMGAYLALERGVPVGRAIRQILDVNHDVPIGRVAHGEDRGPSQALDRAPELVRERLLFPYEAGALFVTDLYRAGGFSLVNRAYASPPSTTEQILHPAKFVAGEGARPVAPLPPPSGARLVNDGTLGELQARTLFRRCGWKDRGDADLAAAGWGGDRYAIFEGAERSLVMGWVSTWDTEQDAIEVEALLASRGDACWSDNTVVGAGGQELTVRGAARVERSGETVVVVRGLDGVARTSWSRALLRLAGPAPRPAPFADVEITPRVPLVEPVRGTLRGDVWENPWLGLVARIPAGMRATQDDHFDLHIEREGVFVRGGVAFSTRVVSPRFIEETFRDAGTAIATEAMGVGTVRVVRSGQVVTPLGPAHERVWSVARTGARIRLLLLPICAETGAVVIVQAYADAHAKAVLDGWLGSMRWSHGRALPACSYLDPK